VERWHPEIFELGLDRPQVAFAAVGGERDGQVGGEAQSLGFAVAQAQEAFLGSAATSPPSAKTATASSPPSHDAITGNPWRPPPESALLEGHVLAFAHFGGVPAQGSGKVGA
jgi:hypothetical protein